MNHGKARTEGKDKWCFSCTSFKPTDGFRSLPGMKRREICAECYSKSMHKTASHPDIENAVRDKRLM
jgi:hypothetical protein